jgi:hypothetical protein
LRRLSDWREDGRRVEGYGILVSLSAARLASISTLSGMANGRSLPRFLNPSVPAINAVRPPIYNKRSTAEQGIKEGKPAAHWTRLSCHRFRANEVRLQLSVLAYNLGNLWRRLVLPAGIDTWSLTSHQQRLVKTGGRLVKHAITGSCWPRVI